MRATTRLALVCSLFAACKQSPTTPTNAPPDAAVADVATTDAEPVDAPDTGVDAPNAQGPTPDDLSATLEPLRARRHLPALAAAVFDGQRMLAQGAVGQRAIDDPTAVQTDDRWHLGSCTKAMTATLLARFVERGVMRWETTLAEAFPDVADAMNVAYRGVTMEQLLQHRGGLPGDIAPDLWSPLWRPGNVVAQRRTFVAAILSRAPATAPGTAFEYSNAGYMIVGAALERATGTAWEDLMRAEVFTPLAMTSCGYGTPATIGSVDAPLGHRVVSGSLVSVPAGPGGDNPPALGPAGTVHCALADWGRFVQLHLRGARHEATSYLTPASFSRMHAAPAGGDYALGWGVASRPWAGGVALTHQGSNTMFLATVWAPIARDRVLLVVTNAANEEANQVTEDALGALIRAHVPTM